MGDRGLEYLMQRGGPTAAPRMSRIFRKISNMAKEDFSQLLALYVLCYLMMGAKAAGSVIAAS